MQILIVIPIPKSFPVPTTIYILNVINCPNFNNINSGSQPVLLSINFSPNSYQCSTILNSLFCPNLHPTVPTLPYNPTSLQKVDCPRHSLLNATVLSILLYMVIK